MTTLEEFLALPDVANTQEEVTLKRLGKFIVKPMTHDQFTSYQTRAKVRKGQDVDFDSGKLNLLIVAGQTISPDFSNAEFLAKANCQTAGEFIKRKFKSGEIAELANQITKISGFDLDSNSFNERVEEAKN